MRRLAALLAVLLLPGLAAPLHARAEQGEIVPLPIESLRVVEVTSLDTRTCTLVTDVTLTPESPVFEGNTGCTDMRLELVGNQIHLSRVPGGEDYFVQLRDIRVPGLTSEHPYVQILVSVDPGQSSRLDVSYEIDGVRYLEGGGNSQPAGDFDYTFPAPSGATLVYDRGIVVVRDDEHQYVDFSARLQAEIFTDGDMDGEHDATDRCPNTPVGEEVDDGGCSLVEYCSTFDANTREGRKGCLLADWKNDEAGRVRDCTLEIVNFRPRDVQCVPD